MQGWWATSYIVLWLLVMVLCVVVVALARQIGTLHLRLGPRGALEVDSEGPPLGEAPPIMEATTIDGAAVTIGGPERPALLLFASAGCRVCEQVIPALPAVAGGAGLAAYLVTDLDVEEAAHAFLTGRRNTTAVVSGPHLAAAYAVPGTPYVVVLDETGVVRAKGTPNNLEQLEGLVDSAERRSAHALRKGTG